jgi:HlyD family secretion protein
MRPRSVILVAALGVILILSVTISRRSIPAAAHAAGADPRDKVSCLGRLVPGEKVLNIAGPYSVQGPSLVSELMVRRGQRVKKGEILARLQNYESAKAQLDQAEREVQVSTRLLEQVKAGEKQSTIAAQEAWVLKCDAEFKNAETFLQRDRQLREQGTISPSDLDRSELAWRVAQKTYEQATNSLQSLKEVRAVDINVAEARLASAQATARRMKADLDQTSIRAPIDGTVLEILTYPGELLDRNPLLQLGDLDHMKVEAEVYVTDIAAVRAGSRAVVTGDGFAGELSGRVSEIGLQVDQSSIFHANPATFSDKRIVKVWIELTDPAKARGLVNNQVTVIISR